MRLGVLSLVLISGLGGGCARASEPPVRVGSKKFTESVILAEVLTQLAASSGAPAEHRAELGGTRILFDALLAGDIDAYPEYTGTLRQELVRHAGPGLEGLKAALAGQGVRMGPPLGFNNTYAIGMKAGRAQALGIRTLSDLTRHPELTLGFSNEFMERQDGWPSLQKRYGFDAGKVRGLDHDLAYRALEAGEVDGTDLYSTDAEIKALGLRVLEDDLHHFPEYQAVVLSRAELGKRRPDIVLAWDGLANQVDAARMVALNARAKLDHVPEANIARDFLKDTLGISTQVSSETWRSRIVERTLEHLLLVALSLGLAILLGLPLGIASARFPRLGQGLLGVVGLIQTIPSLALLVFMIPLLGIGTRPAIVALLLYSLLPIVRGAHAGLTGISAELQDAALALGLPRGVLLRRIELPLATPAILSGIQTSAVINIGTATLGALIGAGGYGQPILTGIRLADTGLILEGAVPAALLAVGAQGAFTVLEKFVIPRGLRLRRGR
jgi:osmoprotectant transport system permease protein